MDNGDVVQNAYPEASSIAESSYPSADSESASLLLAYPPPSESEEFKEPRFRFDLPQMENNIVVTGQAFPNMSIAIVDVTFNGIVLGSGVSDAEGRFSITVEPLLQGHRIGLTFAKLEPGKSFNDMSIKYFPHRGEGFMNLPNVGVFLDTTLVE